MGRQLKGRAARLLLSVRAAKHGLAVLAVVLVLGASVLPVRAATDGGLQAAPTYDITPCCELCPAAARPETYSGSSYLEDFRVLQQGREGWLFRSGSDLSTRFDVSDASIEELRRLALAMRARGTELVIVPQPPRGLMDPDKLTAQQRKQYDLAGAKKAYAQALARIRLAGVTVPPLDQLVDEHKGYDYFFRRDHHWTPQGAEHTARLVAATVENLPAFRSVARETFVTKPGMLIAKPGTLQKVAEQICGGAYSMQYVTGYVTEPASGSSGALLGDAAASDDASGGGLLDTAASDDAGGLLGGDDGGVPQIVLVGTSNSDSKGGYNFAGYLEQFLSADILNVAITGGSFDGSLLHYLPSEAYQHHPPKIMVWEMPWQDWPGSDKSPYKTFRQAIPLIHNGCEGRPAVLSGAGELHAGSNELLFNGGGSVKDLTGSRYWLDIQFDDPAIKDLHAVIWYFSGQKESLKLHFKQYVDNGGRFVTEFRNDRADYAQATVMGATLEIDQPLSKPLKASAKVCEAVDAPQQTAATEVDDAHH